MMDKIGWSELKWYIKVGVVGGWAILGLYVLTFLVGVIEGLMA